MIQRNNKGFTLIELMIVVAILAILVAIAIPSYLGIQKKAARSEAKSNLQALVVSLESYYAENNDYGVAGTYTFQAGNALGTNYPDVLFRPANLGNKINYDYRIVVGNPPQNFTLTAIPQRGRVMGDLQPTLDSDGNKGPTSFGW